MFVTNQIYAIDHHHGQASRTILSGYPTIRGTTMRAKQNYYLEHSSWVHESLIREPRGHRNMLGSIVTDPVSEESALGVIFLHAFGTFDSCGDSTFATAFAALETGLVAAVAPVTRFVMDTVLGPIDIEADVHDGIVQEVRFANVPAYDVGQVEFAVPELGKVRLDVGYGGQYHGFVDADALRIAVDRKNESGLVAAAHKIWAVAGQTLNLRDPVNGKEIPLNLISFIANDGGPNHFRVAHVYPPGRMGRTPGGTGTSALMGLRAMRGAYSPTEQFRMTSVLGSTFTGTGTFVSLPSGARALRPTLGAKSYMMGIHQFVIDPADPFGRGFVLEG
jgi:proline racemase